MSDTVLAMKLEERFFKKVHKQEFCWNWIGSIDHKGYGRLLKKTWGESKAHRFSFKLMNGEIPSGTVLDHLCKNKRCVNPRHLEPVSSRLNSLRAKNTIAYKNFDKLECPKGHPLLGDNLIISKNGCNGARRCRKCKNEQERIRDRAKRPQSRKYQY